MGIWQRLNSRHWCAIWGTFRRILLNPKIGWLRALCSGWMWHTTRKFRSKTSRLWFNQLRMSTISRGSKSARSRLEHCEGGRLTWSKQKTLGNFMYSYSLGVIWNYTWKTSLGRKEERRWRSRPTRPWERQVRSPETPNRADLLRWKTNWSKKAKNQWKE